MSGAEIRIVIVVDPTLPLGHLANTVAAIGVGLGAAQPILGNVILKDAAGRSIHASADRPVPILQASPDQIRSLLIKALPTSLGSFAVAFPQFARTVHTFTEYGRLFPTRDLSSEVIEGVGFVGPVKWIKSLTGNLKLLR